MILVPKEEESNVFDNNLIAIRHAICTSHCAIG